MTNLSENQISDFQKLYCEQFGLKISKEDAYEQAIKLINLVKATYKPILKS